MLANLRVRYDRFERDNDIQQDYSNDSPYSAASVIASVIDGCTINVSRRV